jgi:cytochrome b subunit of formate dehydrogenase
MLLAGFLHIFHSAFTRKGRHDLKALLPGLLDIREFRETVAYYWKKTLYGSEGLRHPHLGRFSYIHKAEYWALIWGTIVMSVTGFVLWFPVIASRWLPVWGFPLMEMIHYYEAWLATLAIVVWHFFFVIFHPAEAPMSVTWVTGNVTREDMEREFPRELEELEARERPGDPNEGGSTS